MRQDLITPTQSDRPGQNAGATLKVPFGLKDGRMWSPKQVPHGKACGCICPACQAPLVAKAAQSARRRAHFAHLAATDCHAGYETALHRKAKELIAEHLTLQLPAWDGELDMPNPPTVVDDLNCLLYGRRVEFPAQVVTLRDVCLEQSGRDYTPDVIGVDDQGQLMIEIRVSHAVDDLKRRRIQSEGKRLIEIDLSDLSRRQEIDEAVIAQWVLEQVSNRVWLSNPDATEDWRASYRDLKADLAIRNQEIAELRRRQEEQLREQENARARIAATMAEKRASRERYRLQQRSQFRQELEALPALVSTERLEVLLFEYEQRDTGQANALISQVASETVREALRYFERDAWIYQVHPTLWQAAAYHQFVHEQPTGTRFNQRDVARWVIQQFGKEEDLYTLFNAQYKARAEARRAGYAKYRISHWAFSELENSQIPNFYVPINKFVERLAYVKAIEYLPEALGEVCVR